MKGKLRLHLSSIRYKLLFSFVGFIMLPVMIAVLMYYESSKQLLVREINQTRAAALAKTTERMNATAERIVKASHLIVNDPDVLDLLRANQAAGLDDYATFQKYLNVSKKMTNIRDFLLESETYVAVFDFKGHMYSTWTSRDAAKTYEEFRSEPWFRETQDALGTPVWQLSRSMNIENDYVQRKMQLLTMTRLIKGDTGKGYGIVFIGVPIQAVLPELLPEDDSSGGSSRFFLMRNHELLMGDKELFDRLPISGLNMETTAKAGYLLNHGVLKQIGWELIGATPQHLITGQLNALRNKSIVGISFLFFLLCLLFILAMFKAIHPLKILNRSMAKAGNGDFTAIADIKGTDEIAALSHKFNSMVENLRKLIERLSEEQQRKEEARFQALQAQVKPHFLFNTLNSIKWTARLSGAEHVSQMITSLGKLLSYAMKNDREVTTLKEELAFLQSYVSLQNIRFNNEVALDIRVPDTLQEAAILKFTLQPLVENSIMHGKRSPLHITIEAELEGGDLRIVVKDNGLGSQPMPPSDPARDMQLTTSKFSGIGLSNIHDRVCMHFGENYGLKMERGETEGVAVTVRMPYMKGEAQHDKGTDRG